MRSRYRQPSPTAPKSPQSGEPLNLMDKEEWWDVMRRAVPDIDREEFDAYWEIKSAERAKRKINGSYVH